MLLHKGHYTLSYIIYLYPIVSGIQCYAWAEQDGITSKGLGEEDIDWSYHSIIRLTCKSIRGIITLVGITNLGSFRSVLRTQRWKGIGTNSISMHREIQTQMLSK